MLNIFSTVLIGKCFVDMDDVEAAIQEMFQAPHIQVIRSCSKLSKIVLVAIVHVLCRTGMSELTFEKVSFLTFTLGLSCKVITTSITKDRSLYRAYMRFLLILSLCLVVSNVCF